MGSSLCGVKRTDGRVLFLGLPESGKTTALYYLKMNQAEITVPTYRYNSEKIRIGEHIREIWDVGGRVEDREDYLYCMTDVAAVVFYINCAADQKRFTLAINRLELMLTETELEKCAVAIAANKQDLETNVSVVDIKTTLQDKAWMKYRYWKVFPVTATTGDGLHLLMKWVNKHVWKEKKRPVEHNKLNKPKRKHRHKIRHGSFVQRGRTASINGTVVAMRFHHVIMNV